MYDERSDHRTDRWDGCNPADNGAEAVRREDFRAGWDFRRDQRGLRPPRVDEVAGSEFM